MRAFHRGKKPHGDLMPSFSILSKVFVRFSSGERSHTSPLDASPPPFLLARKGPLLLFSSGLFDLALSLKRNARREEQLLPPTLFPPTNFKSAFFFDHFSQFRVRELPPQMTLIRGFQAYAERRLLPLPTFGTPSQDASAASEG